MSICQRCGLAFECAMTEGASEPCWCTQLPILPRQAYVPNKDDAAASRCFCPYCLRGLLAAQNASPQTGN
ncbi:MAG: cysteine-rich CWC family protein [Noviherbaspirillum sp.]